MTMQKDSKRLASFYQLNDRFGCFVENDSNVTDRLNLLVCVSLVEFDFVDNVFRKIKIFQYLRGNNHRILAYGSNSSKFVLIWEQNGQTHL